jgi:adenylate cyclase class IV
MIDFLLHKLVLRTARQIVLLIAQTTEDRGHLEIERKYSLLKVSLASIIDHLKDERFYFAGSLKTTDWFIPSPLKGEMMRLRRESKDGVDTFVLTIKKWIGTVDDGRERHEIEKAIKPKTFFALLLLGKFVTAFRLPTFKKNRDLYTGELEGKRATVAIDEAMGLGEFSGPYMEIEVLAPKNSPSKTIQAAIARLVARIAPEADEVKRSYQEMLELAAL